MPRYQRFNPDQSAPQTLATLAGLAKPPPENEKTAQPFNPYKEKWFSIRRIIMQKRGLDEDTAGKEASHWLLVDYMNENPVQQNDDRLCVHCSKPYQIGGMNSGIAVLNGNGGHIWVHSECHAPWATELEAEAQSFLKAQGVPFAF